MPEESPKTFFSYAREDSKFVLRLVKELRAAGAPVWLDQLDIGPGQHWDTEVERALQECPRHVTVLSPAAVGSPNVMDEVSYALEEHKDVIPLFYRDCTIPFRLRRVQYIDFRLDYDAGLLELLKALGVSTQAPVPAPAAKAVDDRAAETSGPESGAAAQPAREAESKRPELVFVETEASRPEFPSPKESEPIEAMAPPPPPPPKPRLPVATVGLEKKRWIIAGGVVLLALGLLLWLVAANHRTEDQAHRAEATESPAPGGSSNQPDGSTSTSQGQPGEGSSGAVTAATFHDRGVAYENNGQYDLAIENYSQALRLDPNYMYSYLGLGNAYRAKGDYDRAVENYSQALKLNPTYADAYQDRGVAYENKGQYDLAIADYNRVLNLKPDYMYAYLGLGNSYRAKGDYDRAIQGYSQALRLNPTYADAYHDRGVAYENKGQYDLAIADYNRVLNLKPDYMFAYLGLGNAYYAKGDYDRAIQGYNQALKLNPGYADAYNNRGLAYEQEGQYREAIGDFDRALRVDPNVAGAQRNRDRVAAKLQK